MTTMHRALLAQGHPPKTPAESQWRHAIAGLLRNLAHQICAAPDVDQPRLQTGFVSTREDVRACCAALSPAARSAVGSDRALAKLQGILHRVRYLPQEETLLEFFRLVPDWDALHRDFASYLLRRLVALRHNGRQPDASFGVVHAWLRERNRALTQVPYPWAEAVNAASAQQGATGKAPLRSAVPPLPHEVVRRAVGA